MCEPPSPEENLVEYTKIEWDEVPPVTGAGVEDRRYIPRLTTSAFKFLAQWQRMYWQIPCSVYDVYTREKMVRMDAVTKTNLRKSQSEYSRLLELQDHNRIIKLMGIREFQQGPTHAIFLEYFIYHLHAFVHYGGIDYTVENIMFISRQILEGVNFIHSRLYSHRNLSLRSILMKPNGHVKISSLYLAERKRFTFYVPPLITFNYQAPEVLMGLKHDTNAADMWSLGAVIIEMFTKSKFAQGFEKPELLHYLEMYYEELRCVRDVTMRNVIFPKLENFFLYNFDYGPAHDVLRQLLNPNPRERLRTSEALQMPFFNSFTIRSITLTPMPVRIGPDRDIQPAVDFDGVGVAQANDSVDGNIVQANGANDSVDGAPTTDSFGNIVLATDSVGDMTPSTDSVSDIAPATDSGDMAPVTHFTDMVPAIGILVAPFTDSVGVDIAPSFGFVGADVAPAAEFGSMTITTPENHEGTSEQRVTVTDSVLPKEHPYED